MDGASMALCHAATAAVAVPAGAAIAYMSDGAALGEWSLGCWQTRQAGEGLFVGHSLFDGGETWVRIAPDPAGLAITYHVGGGLDGLVPRIMVLAVPGPVTDRPEGHCLLTMLVWRGRDMTQERWRRTVATHEAEIVLIKAQLERAG